MNTTQTTTEAKPHPLDANQVAPQTTPALDSVLRAICMDANYDSLKFVLRSNTAHDGE